MPIANNNLHHPHPQTVTVRNALKVQRKDLHWKSKYSPAGLFRNENNLLFLYSTRPTIDSTLRSIYANHIQQQSNLMPKKCAQQYQQTMPQTSNSNINNSPSTTAVIHRKSHSLDASNILQSSSSTNNIITAAPPPSSSSDLPQSNINAAAVHASATTNTPNNMPER